MSLRRNQSKFVENMSILLNHFFNNKDRVVILEYYRTVETQRIYVARGVSKTLNSKHIIGLAMDLAFLDDIQDDGMINYSWDRYLPYGVFWENLDPKNVWGGRFGSTPEKPQGWDRGHFQYGM